MMVNQLRDSYLHLKSAKNDNLLLKDAALFSYLEIQPSSVNELSDMLGIVSTSRLFVRLRDHRRRGLIEKKGEKPGATSTFKTLGLTAAGTKLLAESRGRIQSSKPTASLAMRKKQVVKLLKFSSQMRLDSIPFLRLIKSGNDTTSKLGTILNERPGKLAAYIHTHMNAGRVVLTDWRQNTASAKSMVFKVSTEGAKALTYCDGI